MRISDDRYSRDRLRLEIALRFIRHEARTRTIRVWTGLTDDRIRKLYRFYIAGSGGAAPPRHRGKSPQQIAFFLRSGRARQQSALFASLCCLLGALPAALPPGCESARALPTLARAELLCQAYELYRALFPAPLISFEHAVFLLSALARADELTLAACRDCGAAMVADRWSLRAPRCALCARDPAMIDPVSIAAGAPLPMAAPGDAAGALPEVSTRPDAVAA
jgi:hypothetical protein